MNKLSVFCGLALLVLTSSMALKASVGTSVVPVPPPWPGPAVVPVPPPWPGPAVVPVPPPYPR
jgi:hypothetical protein